MDSKDSTESTLTQREGSHGPFSAQASLAQKFKQVYYEHTRTGKLDWHEASIIDEAVEMILHKISRAAVGDPMHKDHWDDIAGYAKLVPKFIERCK